MGVPQENAKRIAVTGATGFVGQHLLTHLSEQGYQIKALTRRPQPTQKNIQWIEGDFDNQTALTQLVNDVDAIIHLAGVVKGRKLADFTKINVDSIANLLKTLKEQSFKPHFILMSSLAATRPELSDYAQSKRQGEEYLINHADDIPWSIIRPPAIYGPGDMEILKLIEPLKYNLAFAPGSIHNRNSVIYVSDLIRALPTLLCNKDAYGKTLGIDDGEENGYSLEEIFSHAAALMGKNPIKITVPGLILKTFGHLNLFFAQFLNYTPMVTPKKVNELIQPRWLCQDTHVMNVTGWKPTVKLTQGLEESLKWYKQNKLL